MTPATTRGTTSQSYHIVNTKSCHILGLSPLNRYRIFDTDTDTDTGNLHTRIYCLCLRILGTLVSQFTCLKLRTNFGKSEQLLNLDFCATKDFVMLGTLYRLFGATGTYGCT